MPMWCSDVEFSSSPDHHLAACTSLDTTACTWDGRVGAHGCVVTFVAALHRPQRQRRRFLLSRRNVHTTHLEAKDLRQVSLGTTTSWTAAGAATTWASLVSLTRGTGTDSARPSSAKLFRPVSVSVAVETSLGLALLLQELWVQDSRELFRLVWRTACALELWSRRFDEWRGEGGQGLTGRIGNLGLWGKSP